MTIKRLKRRLRDRLNLDYWKTFISVLGTISAIVTLISFIFEIQNPHIWVILLYLLCVFGGSIAIAFFLTMKKKSLKLNISNNLEILINSGDLFEYAIDTNYIVIPVNEYFDTVVNTKIVSPSTLHGQFINKYFGFKHPELHDIIQSYLDSNKIEYIEEVQRPYEGGYSKKYPLGTCVPVQIGQVTFILLSLTHFDEYDHAYVELSEFGRCISSICHYLESHAGDRPAYMPLMGMGLSRLNKTGQFILKYTLDTIVGVKDLAIPGGLNVVVYPPTLKTLDLNAIKY